MELITAISTGFILGLSAGIAPGPMLTLVVTQSLRYGAREGLKVSLSPLLTDFPIIAITLFLLSGIAHFDIYIGVISFAGGIYVAVLAYECFYAKISGIAAQSAAPRSLKKGIVVNFLNPHPYVFWITIGSPLLIKYYNAGISTAAGFIAIFYVMLVGSKIALAVVAGGSRRLLDNGWYSAVMRILGILLIIFSITLLRDAVRYLFYD